MTTTPSPRGPLQRFAVWLARVTAVAVGKDDDGLNRVAYSESEIDKPWGEQYQELQDVLDAWRHNPIARRLIGLQVGYIVSDGLKLSASYGPLKKYLKQWAAHPKNNLPLLQAELYEELARAGELFLTLHTNPADGISYIRAIPASRIDKVDHVPGDYKTELAYHENVPVDDPDFGQGGRLWLAPAHPEADEPEPPRAPVDPAARVGVTVSLARAPGTTRPRPLMLHYAINRPVGALRGESDLAPILPWLRRYNRWLEDRVRLNAAMRAFLWILHVPARLVAAKTEQYRHSPEAGTVIIAEKDAEDWQAINPAVNAGDAAADGRAIKYMVLAGSTGFALTDLGEGEDANLATAKAMGEQKARWLGQRQAYFGFILRDLALSAYNRAVRLGLVTGKEQNLDAISVTYPDINPADNAELAQAAKTLGDAFKALNENAGIQGETWQRKVLTLGFEYMGRSLDDGELDKFIAETVAQAAEAAAAQGGLPGQPGQTPPAGNTDLAGGGEWWSVGAADQTGTAPAGNGQPTGAPAGNTAQNSQTP